MIKVYTGPMFSGKSNKMFSVMQGIYHQKLVMCFKAKKDARTPGEIWTRVSPDKPIPAIDISALSEIKNYLSLYPTVKIIFIDEAMLIDGPVECLIDLSVDDEIDIHIAGLDMTSEQAPFGIMPDLLAIADEVIKLKSECSECGRPASYSYYLAGEKTDGIVIGDQEYTALCAKCLAKEKNRSSYR